MSKIVPVRGIPAAVSTLLRFCFAAAFGVSGFFLGRALDLDVLALHLASSMWQNLFRFGSPVLGSLGFVVLSPFAQRIFERELVFLEEASESLSQEEILGCAAGFAIALVLALLLRFLLARLLAFAGEAGDVLFLLAACLLAASTMYVGLRVGARRRDESVTNSGVARRELLLDTSVIIDGRIVEISRTGFLEGVFLVPRFVLGELQTIADSHDPVRRARGRRGLELLTELTEQADVVVLEAPEQAELEVDARLVILAKERAACLLTSDYNLNRVATVEGVRVLNVNELAQAMRPVLQIGQELTVTITRDGREAHQGIGYLDDGTMIVVENGRAHRGEDISVTVTSVIQTAAGRMIFAKPG